MLNRTCIAPSKLRTIAALTPVNRRTRAGMAIRCCLPRITTVAAAIALLGPPSLGAISMLTAGSAFARTAATGMVLQLLPATADTLAILLDRVLALEPIVESSVNRMDSLDGQLALERRERARERHERLDELEGLRVTLALLSDSNSEAAAMLARVEADLDGLRSEAAASRSRIDDRFGGIARHFVELDSTTELWRAAVADSMAMVDSQILEEQLRRVSADRSFAVATGTAAGLLVFAIAWVWWYSRRRDTALEFRVRQNQSDIAGQPETSQDETTDEVRQQSIETLGKLLGPIAQMVAMLDTLQALQTRGAATTAEPSHELPVSVCNVVNRIERNLRAMDARVRGHKHLLRCVRDVKGSLRLHNYEMPDLVGQRYDTQMENLRPEFDVDDRMAPGEQIITRLIKPLVLYRGKPVQGAWVKVSVGP